MDHAKRSLSAGIAYFLMLFGLGFVLGSVRSLMVSAGMERTPLVLIELPIMLAYAWWSSGWVARRFSIPATLRDRVIMGGVMFILLRVSEGAVGVFLMETSVQSQLASFTTAMGALELSAQVACAFFPVLQARRT